ncbi:uncharacterized protein LOC143368499 isoform X2 [Andrena cerasifolii]
MKSIESSRWKLLKLGTTVPIKPGDVCSLIPHKCWFKVVLVPDIMEDIKEHPSKRKANEDVISDISNKKLCSESGEGDNLQSANHALTKLLTNNNDVVKAQGEILNKENSTGDKCAVEVVLQNFQEIHDASFKDEDEALESNSQVIREPQNTDQLPSLEHDPCKFEDASETVAKVLPREEALSNSENLDSTSQDEKPVTTDDVSPTSAQTDEPNASADAVVDVPRREKCIYGKECYRKNPQHKAEFSHPGDSDFDIPDDREECYYGMRCYRTNPQHRLQYKHTTSNDGNDRRKQLNLIPSYTSPEAGDFYTDDSDEDESIDESEYEPSGSGESSDADELIYLNSCMEDSDWEYDTSD